MHLRQKSFTGIYNSFYMNLFALRYWILNESIKIQNSEFFRLKYWIVIVFLVKNFLKATIDNNIF